MNESRAYKMWQYKIGKSCEVFRNRWTDFTHIRSITVQIFIWLTGLIQCIQFKNGFKYDMQKLTIEYIWTTDRHPQQQLHMSLEQITHIKTSIMHAPTGHAPGNSSDKGLCHAWTYWTCTWKSTWQRPVPCMDLYLHLEIHLTKACAMHGLTGHAPGNSPDSTS